MNEKSDQQLSISKIYHACRIAAAAGRAPLAPPCKSDINFAGKD